LHVIKFVLSDVPYSETCDKGACIKSILATGKEFIYPITYKIYAKNGKCKIVMQKKKKQKQRKSRIKYSA